MFECVCVFCLLFVFLLFFCCCFFFFFLGGGGGGGSSHVSCVCIGGGGGGSTHSSQMHDYNLPSFFKSQIVILNPKLTGHSCTQGDCFHSVIINMDRK